MVLHKKKSCCSIKTFIFYLTCIIVFCSLLFMYFIYRQVFINYPITALNKDLPMYNSSENHKIVEINNNSFDWNKNGLVNTASSMSSGTYININSYPYIINEPNKCKDQSPTLIFLIATVAKEHENRAAIRSTFGNEALKSGTSIIRLFMLGVDNTVEPNIIAEESEKYHDIIQKDFQDTYRNLTIKTIMGIEWVSNHCPNANYVMKTDSDMFVNTEHLLKLLGSDKVSKQNYFTGYLLLNHRPHRHKESKWHMPPSLYSGEFYPSFCSGTGYLFSGDVAPKVLRASFKVKFVYLEDVFVGICLDRERIPVTAPPAPNLFNNFHVTFNPCVYNNIITSHYFNPSDLINVWKIMQEHKETCK
ncbi:beta-1,3-galactosyltransferase 2-like [Mixophyes fleayi]|uniref:beta-1,3-galactosyltransferase 2-like n=1 Tax=Mixophyes fleayi TaxID=3061075 RepID=UPI003F4E31F3